MEDYRNYVIILLLVFTSSAWANDFRVGIELSSQVPVTQAIRNGLDEIGINYINYYVKATKGGELPANRTNREMMTLCEDLGLDFSIAIHHLDPPDEVIKAAVAFGRKNKGNAKFLGVLFDELEHCRLLHSYSPTPLADASTFTSLQQAHAATAAGFRKLRQKYERLGADATATHCWPLMHHIAARAGFTVCPKICKEYYSTVSFAVAMGAAKQYDRDLWADCDLWFWDLIPGHPPEEMESNLKLAYWLGVDLVYIEGCGYNLRPAGNQGTPFSLINQISDTEYQLTPHGETLRRFCAEYLKSPKRSWTFRDVKPEIAIIRFEDTCHGQRYSADWDDHLFGSPRLNSDRDTEAWLGLWNLLTHGKVGRDGLSCYKTYVRSSGYERPVVKGVARSYLSRPVQADTHRFFVPLNGVVVYNHLVGYDLLKDVPLLCLTGVEVSEDTMAAIRRRVSEGATCVAWGPLAKRKGFADYEDGVRTIDEGKGKFILTDDFGRREVHQQIKQWIGRPDEIRYQFGSHMVKLKRVTDNEVDIQVWKTK